MLFDPPAPRARLREITAVRIANAPESGAAALLLCGWLRSRLGWTQGILERDGHGSSIGTMGEIEVRLNSVHLDVPGLEGVTLRFRDGAELSLDRGPGGLRATRRDPAGAQRTWTLLGASRGEGGILGEGLRQSLLRDPSYGEALASAAAMLT